jgi:hypothetical protein
MTTRELAFPDFYPPSQEIADALGFELDVHFDRMRLWHGEATLRFVIERVAELPEAERRTAFFRAFEAVKKARKQASIWPLGNHRDWYPAGEEGDAASAAAPVLFRPVSGRYATGEERIEAAELLIGRVFSDRALLARALTHASALPPHNEALACLGDRIFNAWAARRVFARAPEPEKGPMTDAIIALIKGSAQAEVFFALGLHELLVVGGGTTRITSPMASTALEAIVAALDLDGGPAAAEAFLDRVVGAAVVRPLGEGPG